jgi:nucleoid-associated protein YgaU
VGASAETAAVEAPDAEPAEGAVESAAVEPAVEPAFEPAVTEAAAAPAGETAAVAPVAVLVNEEGARVLQSPGSDAGAPRNVTIDAITYSTRGDVQLSGRGDAGTFVRLYIDNRPVLDTPIDSDGAWGGRLPEVAAGLYALRADQIDAEGKVLSRYETPFQREAPELLAAAAPDASGGRVAAKITVQPGFTLWGIASSSYGAGVQYVRVYEANKELIRDPDLIYPGQVFVVPAQ